MKGACDFCGRYKELCKYGEARICFVCLLNQKKKPTGKWIKGDGIDKKTMPTKTFSEYSETGTFFLKD